MVRTGGATPPQVRAPAPMSRATTPRPTAVLLLFATSGATGLVLEVVWSRLLHGLLGATTWAVLAVLAAYMGGLGLGSLVWGRVVGRTPRPLRLYGWLELGVGAYALAVPAIVRAVGGLVALAAQTLGEPVGSGVGVRVAAAVLALTPPTLLMGGTLPVLTRFAAAGGGQPGRTAAALYAANTLGAVVGCFAAGCALILWLGVVETNTLAGVAALAVGCVALALDRRGGAGGAAVPDPAAAAAGPRAGGAALGIAAVSGFCGLAYEVFWTRGLLAAMTDDTTYAFTLMLTAFLAGHALGAALGGAWRPSRPADDWRRLGACQVFAALTASLSLPLLVAARGPLGRTLAASDVTFWGSRVPTQLGVSLAVFAPAAAFLGASFALASRLYVGRGRPVGASTGRLYGLNTLAAILGAVAAVAWLIPRLGTQRALVALAAVQAAVGLVTLVFGGGPVGRSNRAFTALGLAAAVASAVALNALLPLTDVYRRREPGRLLALVEGSGASISVHQRTTGDRVISVNGVNVAGTNPVLRATQKLQAHLPVCLHPRPREVLQIGFGSGGTCYSVSLHGGVESIEVVELNPDVLAVASAWFADVNHGVLNDRRVRARIVDARSHVAVTARTYDLILSDSTHPRFRGNASLYTRDYFALCARRLRPGGLFSTWLPLYGLSVDDVRGILKSLNAVFPHVQVWYPNSEPNENTVVIASLDPIAVDYPRVCRTLAEPKVAADLAEVGVISPAQFLDFFLLGERAAAAFARPGRLNTDDHPRLEFLAPRSLRRMRSWSEDFDALRRAREPIDGYLVGADPAARAELARWYAGTTWKLAGQAFELQGRFDDARKAYAEAARTNPADRGAFLRASLFRAPAAPPGLATPATGGF